MAPEYFGGNYSTGVDIWAFGMTILEVITHRKPYFECDDPEDIKKKITSGIMPLQLSIIQDDIVKDFIELCLSTETERPAASKLLNSFFFLESEADNSPVTLGRYFKESFILLFN